MGRPRGDASWPATTLVGFVCVSSNFFDLLRGPHQNIMWNLIVKCWPRIQSHSHFTGGQNIPFPTRPGINLGRNPQEIKTHAHRNTYGAILSSRLVGKSRSPQMTKVSLGTRMLRCAQSISAEGRSQPQRSRMQDAPALTDTLQTTASERWKQTRGCPAG